MLLKVSGKCGSFEVKAAHRNQKAQISFAEFRKVLKPPSQFGTIVNVRSTRVVTTINDVPENLK